MGLEKAIRFDRALSKSYDLEDESGAHGADDAYKLDKRSESVYLRNLRDAAPASIGGKRLPFSIGWSGGFERLCSACQDFSFSSGTVKIRTSYTFLAPR